MTEPGRSKALAVFDELARQGIRYCLWRGSVRVDRAFAGASDFDLLVAPEQAGELAALLLRLGCRRGRSARPEPGLEDYFALGGPGGPLLHLHVHHRLVAGEPRNNRFLLPWARPVLDSRVRRAADALYVAAPVVECALLLVRCCLQLRWRDRFGGAGGRQLIGKVNGDLAALLPGRDLAPVHAVLQEWLGGAVPLPATGLPTLSTSALWRLRAFALRALLPLALARGVPAALSCWRAEAAAGLRRLARRLGLPILPARGGVCGGLLVALDGADPATRRALAAEVRQVFGGKFDVLCLPLRGGALRRALRARSRGMLVISDTAVPGPARYAPDVVVTLPADRPRDELLAGLLQQVWNRL